MLISAYEYSFVIYNIVVTILSSNLLHPGKESCDHDSDGKIAQHVDGNNKYLESEHVIPSDTRPGPRTPVVMQTGENVRREKGNIARAVAVGRR